MPKYKISVKVLHTSNPLPGVATAQLGLEQQRSEASARFSDGSWLALEAPRGTQVVRLLSPKSHTTVRLCWGFRV